MNLISSNYHIEVTPSDAGQYDRLVIQDILKEIAQTQQVDQNAARRFKVIVINEADQLSRDAQAALRRTMEKYMRNLRLVLCANSTSRIIAPIRSRCLLMRVGAPSDEDMTRVLRHVAKREKFHLPDDIAAKIVANADGNTRKALLMLETMRVQSYVAALTQPGFDGGDRHRAARLADVLRKDRGHDCRRAITEPSAGSAWTPLRAPCACNPCAANL